jgi:predicted acylesterase/phospholipase RssA
MGEQPNTLGLALSGGGSRAMAFHVGTLRGLLDLHLARRVDVVSTVSGGSVFGAAWLCRHGTDEQFLEGLKARLMRGFLQPALFSIRALKLLLPGFTRTHRLAEVFSETLLQHRRLDQLPERPLLCLNASVLNHAMPGRFSRAGFSCRDVGVPDDRHSYPEVPLERRDLGFAVAASACFPFALPPLTLDASELPPFHGRLSGHTRLHLTDGGVLENLGVERLLGGGRFAAEHIIASDAGVGDTAWKPSLLQNLASFGAFALSRSTLSRLLAVMNDKQSKTMRQYLLHDLGAVAPPRFGRTLWFVRIDQTWEHFFTGISEPRRKELARGAAYPAIDAPADEVTAFLEQRGVDLARAKAYFLPDDSARCNAIVTNFTGLKATELDALERHARWQIHACRAVYGDIPAAAARPVASATTVAAGAAR